MKLSNFALTKEVWTGRGGTQPFAEVDVTTGVWIFKRTVRRQISLSDGMHWFFVDTGEFTPGYQAENLHRAWRASVALKGAQK